MSGVTRRGGRSVQRSGQVMGPPLTASSTLAPVGKSQDKSIATHRPRGNPSWLGWGGGWWGVRSAEGLPGRRRPWRRAAEQAFATDRYRRLSLLAARRCPTSALPVAGADRFVEEARAPKRVWDVGGALTCLCTTIGRSGPSARGRVTDMKAEGAGGRERERSISVVALYGPLLLPCPSGL